MLVKLEGARKKKMEEPSDRVALRPGIKSDSDWKEE